MKIRKRYDGLPLPVRAALWFTVCNIIQKGISFLTLPVYTRLMSTEEYGMYQVFLSWLEIFEILATFRLGWGGYVVGLTKFEDDRDGYTSSMQTLSLFITLLTFVLYMAAAPVIDRITGLDRFMTSVIFGILLFIPAMQIWMQRRRTEYRYRSVIVVSVLLSLASFLGGCTAAVTSAGKASAVVFSRFVIQALACLPLILANCRGRFVFYDSRYWKRAFIFNLPLLPYYLSMVLLHSADKIMIQNIIGISEAGIYGAAYTISMCMQIFSQAVNQTIQPWMFRKMKQGCVKAVPRVIHLTLFMIAGANFLFTALAPEIIAAAAPPRYYDAVKIIPPLSASVAVMYFYQHFVNVEFYFEESRLTSAASVGAAVMNILLNRYLIPRFGYCAAGYTTMISYLFFAGIHYLFMKRVCKKRGYREKICDIRVMLFILVFFQGLSIALSAVYEKRAVRYAAVMLPVVFAFLKRRRIKAVLCGMRKELQE